MKIPRKQKYLQTKSLIYQSKQISQILNKWSKEKYPIEKVIFSNLFSLLFKLGNLGNLLVCPYRFPFLFFMLLLRFQDLLRA